jgi:predicted  nucleic acid-binding Zn-ribbon protein
MVETLKQYQELEGKTKRINDEINRSEEAKTFRKLGQFLKEAQDESKKMEGRASDLNMSYSKLHEQFTKSVSAVSDLESGVDHAEDADELNYVAKRVSELTKSIGILEREISTVQKEMEDIVKRYENLAAKLPVAQKQYADAKNTVAKMRKDKDGEFETLKAEAEKLEKKIDPVLLASYKRLRDQGIFPAYVQLNEGNKCGGCQMDIPSGTVSKLDDTNFIICENCGRMVSR